MVEELEECGTCTVVTTADVDMDTDSAAVVLVVANDKVFSTEAWIVGAVHESVRRSSTGSIAKRDIFGGRQV